MLATLCSTRIKASRQTVAKSLHGNRREELLFLPTSGVNSYRFAQNNKAKSSSPMHASPNTLRNLKIAPRSKHRLASLKSKLHRICCVDSTKIPGIKEQAAPLGCSQSHCCHGSPSGPSGLTECCATGANTSKRELPKTRSSSAFSASNGKSLDMQLLPA